MSRRESLLSAPYQTRSPQGGRPGRSDRVIRGLSLAATLAALATIVLGAVVRATGAGDACGADWPICNGRIIPELDALVLIEYTHRLATPVLIGLIGALTVAAWRRYRGVRRIVGPATAAFGLLFVQAALGALVVRRGLSPALVTAHLATAMLLVGSLVVATASSWTLAAARLPRDGVVRAAWTGAAFVFLVILVGAFVRGEGAGLAFTDWPLMGGRVIPDLSSEAHVSQFAHRLAALLALPVFAWVAARTWRVRAERPGTAALAAAALGALLVQVLVGALNVWTRLATGARIAHVALASLAWAAAVASAATSRAGRTP
jgi:heme A synthase